MRSFNDSSSADAGKLVLRLAVGGLMLFHGVSKLLSGVGWIEQMLAGLGLPGFLAYGVYVAEVVAPVLLLLGLLTRPAALMVMVDMVAAIALVFSDRLFTVKEAGGGWAIELEAFFFLAALAVALLGAGRYSVSKGQGRWD
jgi:putative oxidoreductase